MWKCLMQCTRDSCRILKEIKFYRVFLRKAQTSSFIEIRKVGDELFHADERTDVAKPIVACRNFANAF
jgi:hypothetical protein